MSERTQYRGGGGGVRTCFLGLRVLNSSAVRRLGFTGSSSSSSSVLGSGRREDDVVVVVVVVVVDVLGG